MNFPLRPWRLKNTTPSFSATFTFGFFGFSPLIFLTKIGAILRFFPHAFDKLGWDFENFMYRIILFLILTVLLSCKGGEQMVSAPQYPSPMEEHIRPYLRVDGADFSGKRIEIEGVFQKNPVLFIHEQNQQDPVNLLIHFHGHESILAHAIGQNKDWVGVSVNLGAGSAAYAAPFLEKEGFDTLLSVILANLNKSIRGIYLSGFSAGYGAVRAILRTGHYESVLGVLLLDGLHASYVPERTPLADGGKIKEEDLDVFLRLAEDAIAARKKFVFTHSSVFPGTFVSTTEAADFLLRAMDMRREAVLGAGPLGMQQVGESAKGNFKVLAFAGNTAPDHIDHLHALFHFLKYLAGEL